MATSGAILVENIFNHIEDSSQSGSIQEYFNEYPALKLPAGYQLLVNDFAVLYKNIKDELFSNVKTLRDKIFELAKKKSVNVCDKDVHQNIENYFFVTNNTECPLALNNEALLLLLYITSSVPLKKKKLL